LQQEKLPSNVAAYCAMECVVLVLVLVLALALVLVLVLVQLDVTWHNSLKS